MGRRASPHPKIKFITFQVGNYYERYELKHNRIFLVSTNAPSCLLPDFNIKASSNNDLKKDHHQEKINLDLPMPIDDSIFEKQVWEE